mmetsp:Transcript_12220/g.49069  ORF Transcript_12220/g.49069 Transcript_12220/m.49069 type:complete len:269 (+) Transcript_12220:2854-3660(+)
MRGGGEQTLRPIRRDGRVRRAAGLRRRLRVRPRRRLLRRPGRRSRVVPTERIDGRRGGHVRAARRAEGEDAPAARLSRRSVPTPRVHDRARPVRRQARHRARGERRSEGGRPGQGVDRGGGGGGGRRRRLGYARRRERDGPRDQALHQQGRREAPAGRRRRRGHRLRRGALRSHGDGHGVRPRGDGAASGYAHRPADVADDVRRQRQQFGRARGQIFDGAADMGQARRGGGDQRGAPGPPVRGWRRRPVRGSGPRGVTPRRPDRDDAS